MLALQSVGIAVFVLVHLFAERLRFLRFLPFLGGAVGYAE